MSGALIGRLPLAALLAAIVVLGGGLYLGASSFPAFEDEARQMEALGSASPAGALGYRASPDEARPLANLAAQALVKMSGTVRSVRIASAILHGITAVGIFLLVGTLLRRGEAAGSATVVAPAAGAVLFVVHPLATEAVITHASFPTILAVAFAVGAVLVAARAGGPEAPPRRLAAPALYLGALLCDASLWPIGFIAAALDRRGSEEGASPRLRSCARAFGPYAVALLLYYACWAARAWPDLLFIPAHRPWSIVEGIASQATALLTEVRLLVAPWALSVDHGDPAFLGSWNFKAVGGAAILAVLLVAAAALGRKGTLPVVALRWFVFPHLHVLLFPPEFPLQERRLYASIVAVALAAAAGIDFLERRAGARTALAAAALAATPLLFLTAARVHLWEDPVALWRSAAASSPESARPRVVLADILLERGDVDGALESLEGALAVAPRSARIQNSLAEIYLQKGDYARAAREASKAMDIDPRYLPAYITAGNSFMLRDQPRDAFLAFNAALRLDPEDPSALYSMGALLFQQKRYKKAAEMLQMAAAKRPGDPETLFRLGMALVNTGDLAGAKEALRTCLAAAPARVDAGVNLASILTTLGESEEARQILTGILDREPGNSKALNGLGVLATAQSRWEEARDLFERAAADPNDQRTLYNLAGAYEKLGQREMAIGAYRRFLAGWTGELEVSEAARARLARLEASPSP